MEIPDPYRQRWAEDWADIIARCKEKPGEWAVMLPDRQYSLLTTVHLKKSPPFVTSDGRLRAAGRNMTDKGGQKRADLYFRWEPITKPGGRK